MKRLAFLLVVVCPLWFGCGKDSPAQPSQNPPLSQPQPSGPTKVIGLTGSLNFGDVVLGEVATRELTIRNTGTTELKISGVTLPPAFATNWQSWREGTIAPNASATITIYFVPDAPRSFSGSLNVAADHTSGTNTLTVNGSGVFGPVVENGRIVDAEVVQNILTHNQNSTSGRKAAGAISRWQLPLPVYLGPDIDRNYAIEALNYLEANAGISYVLMPSNADPVVIVSSATLGGSAGGQGGINDVYSSNNQSRRGFVTISTQNVPCRFEEGCMNMYRHEFMHALGIYGHLSYPAQPVYVPGGFYPFKEMAVLRALYAMPHGARLNADGTWR